jgi:hypothetical protein
MPDGTNEKTLYGPYWYGDYVLRPGGGWLLFREAPGGWWIARRIDMNGSNVKTLSHDNLSRELAGWTKLIFFIPGEQTITSRVSSTKSILMEEILKS